MSSIAQVRRVLKGQVQAGAAAFTDYWTDSEIERACRDWETWGRYPRFLKLENTKVAKPG